jgi:hypothetical protein
MTNTSDKKIFTRDDIQARYGGGKVTFLPNIDGRVTCACLTLRKNPDAPRVILVSGEKPKVYKAGLMLANQNGSIPAFLKEAPGRWLYVGEFEVERSSQEAADIEYWQARAGRTDVRLVIFMRAVGTEFSHAA